MIKRNISYQSLVKPVGKKKKKNCYFLIGIAQWMLLLIIYLKLFDLQT